MTANNLCRCLILNSVKHSADAVLFLTDIIPPFSKCTVVFGTGKKIENKVMDKTMSTYETKLYCLLYFNFQSRILRNTCVLQWGSSQCVSFIYSFSWFLQSVWTLLPSSIPHIPHFLFVQNSKWQVRGLFLFLAFNDLVTGKQLCYTVQGDWFVFKKSEYPF